MEKRNVWKLYSAVANEFDRTRGRSGHENVYLDLLAARLPPAPARILDLGCGTGEPIARYFIERDGRLTGIDAAPEMLALASKRFPDHDWLEADMRDLALGNRFDAIIAWDSFFLLPRDDQRAMFDIFASHCAADGLLLFTSGPAAGEAIGDLFGQTLYHASLDPTEYASLLETHGFEIIRHTAEDPDCAGHTVWLAQRRNARGPTAQEA
ncbi:MAG: methyltransferase domain-containing protein [Rhodospirillaceae bacterium]|nr:methyltransferase domain-containing protein [Rhodospirillaceae bacterium]